MPVIVIAAYRPKPGQDAALLEILRDHVPYLRREMLRTLAGLKTGVMTSASAETLAGIAAEIDPQARLAMVGDCRSPPPGDRPHDPFPD